MRQRRLSRFLGAMVGFAAIFGATACDRQSEGVVQVVVIGDPPKLVDPARGPLGTSEKVLIDNAGQGLLRFDAKGQIEPGLAETWNVSDDGLSYIFRLANGEWPNGRKITAEQVARMLRRLIASSSRDELKDALGAVDEIVAMTDRVIEIRLKQPRPHLLQLLAQPEMGLVYERQGTGPFAINREKSSGSAVRLTREVAVADEESSEREQVDLRSASAAQAVEAFKSGKADLVLGGTFLDLPLVQQASVARRALRFDPAAGLFGLAPLRDDGLLGDPEVRSLLSASIDRDALIAALAVPGLIPRATVLEPGLDNVPDPAPPAWTATPLADRRPSLLAEARRLLPPGEDRVIRVLVPDGPGGDILIDRLSQDWGALGLRVERAEKAGDADLRLIDQVAPSTSAAWFLRHFRCAEAAVCSDKVDELLQGARDTAVLAQRSAFLTVASKQIDELQLFIPLAAPIRWSLVSERITGFAGNRFAIHTLTGLEQRLNRTGE